MAVRRTVRGLISVNLYNLKSARRLNAMKCCQASSRIRWLNGEKPTFREHRNVGLVDSQPPDAASSPRIFGRICKFNFLNDLYRAIHLKLYPVQKSVSCFFTEYRASSNGGVIAGLFASTFSWVFFQGGVWMAMEV